MFEPKYIVTNTLLSHIKRITQVITILNERRFSKPVLLEFTSKAREISAHASTSIEGNPLPLTDVKQLLKNAPNRIRDTEREVLNYNNALISIHKSLAKEKLALKFIQRTHKNVIDKLLPKHASGVVRKEPVFVNNPRTGKTIFWPPDHDDVDELLNELIQYSNQQREEVDPLIIAGLFHKQFVLIHPFVDGNGRTVRLLTTFLLAGMGLNTFNLFSFERYYNGNVTTYFERVGEQGNYYDLKVDFTSWLEYFTGGILDELLRVQDELDRSSFAPASGLKEHHKIVIDYLNKYGSITDSIYSELVKRAKSTRAVDFSFLIDQQIIVRKGKSRATYYVLKG